MNRFLDLKLNGAAPLLSLIVHPAQFASIYTPLCVVRITSNYAFLARASQLRGGGMFGLAKVSMGNDFGFHPAIIGFV